MTQRRHNPFLMGELLPCVVLLSGGLDSTTVLAIARSEGFCVHALTFRYGQRHEHELRAAKRVAAAAEVAHHRTLDIELGALGDSALTTDIPVPKSVSLESRTTGIPVTYVPARNTVFLSYGLALADVVGAHEIYIGVNAVDYSGYPDCRPEYIEAFERMANLATRLEDVRIRAPLLRLSKAEIVRLGMELGVDYSLTSTCYDPDPNGVACGQCEACHLRREGFAGAGVPDPIRYQT